MGDKLEQGDLSLDARKRRNIIVKLGIISTVLIATMLVFPRGQVYQYTVEVDDIWRQQNLNAPFSFAIQKPQELIDSERARIRRQTPPIFRRDTETELRLEEKTQALDSSISRILGHYGRFQLNTLRGRIDEALRDSLAFVTARDSLPVRFEVAEWDEILASYANWAPGLIANTRSRINGERLDQEALNMASIQVLKLLDVGVLNMDKNAVSADSIAVRNNETFQEISKALPNVLSLSESISVGNDEIALRWPRDVNRYGVSSKLFHFLLEPNLLFDEDETQERWADRESEIVPTESLVHENEVIVRQGDRVNEDIQRKLISLENELNRQAGDQIPWRTLLGHFVLTAATFLMFFLYLFLLRRPIFDDNRMILLIVVLFLGVIGFYGVALRAALLDMYVVPVAIVAIMFTVIFDSRVALFGALTLSLMGSHLLNYDFAFTFSTIFASTLGIFSVRDIRNRGQFFISASLVFAGYMTVLCANLLLQGTAIDRFTDLTIFAGINSFLLLLAYPMLWLFERAFNITTDLTLLELSDMNRPLLKELSMKAPGTFNHVLQVANLSETAAVAIGANALLARVGALYHDIGKMVKPEYFVENQRGGVNPHDGLKPRMSALIIASHVKEGLEMAGKHRLPEEVEDFIPMHHGTTRIEYFYQKALTQVKEGDAPVQESEFRYPGPTPSTKETSILMLADGIEAASRALDKPTHKRLEGLIDAIVEARREDGQLDQADLTFSELNTIKEAFLTALMGIHHLRVKYPGDEERAPDSWSGNQATQALDG